MTEEITHERFRSHRTFVNRPRAANNGAPAFTKLGPCLDRIKPLLGPSLEDRVRSVLEEFVCKSSSRYAKRFPRVKKFLNTVTTWAGCLDASVKDTDTRQEMIKHAIEYLVKDGLVTQFADPVVLNRAPNKVDADSLAAEQNQALKSMNVWRFINEKDYWLCQDCATCVDAETTLQIHHCEKVTSNSDLDVEVGSLSQESSTFYSTCRTNSICSPVSNRRIENPVSQARINCRDFQLILESNRNARNPEKIKFDNANEDSSKGENIKTLDLKVKFNCGAKLVQTQTSQGNLNFIFEASESMLNRTPNESSNVANRPKPVPRGGCSKGSDTRVKHGCSKFPKNCKIQIYVHKTTSTSRSDIRKPPNISNLSLPCKSSQLIVRLFEAEPSLSDSCLILMRKRFEKDISNACSCMNDVLRKLDETLIKQLRLNCEIRPGRVDLNLSCKTGETMNKKSKSRWFLGRVPTCSNVHKRGSRHELVESCENSNADRPRRVPRGSTILPADAAAERSEIFEEPRVASPRSVCSVRGSMETKQICRNEIENEREEKKSEVDLARKAEKQVDFVVSSRTINLQDDKDSVIPVQTDIERSERRDTWGDDDEICEGEIDRSRLLDNRGKEEMIMGQCKAEETVDVSKKSEKVWNDGFIVGDSENKLIELYDLKCDCSSDNLKADGFGGYNSTTEGCNLEGCSRHASCTSDRIIEHNPSRMKDVGKKNSKDPPCHVFRTSGRMIKHSSNLDDKEYYSRVNHCHVICMNDRMVEHNLSRTKNVDNKNSKVDVPTCTNDRVIEHSSNLDDKEYYSRVNHCHVICMNDRMIEHNVSRMKVVDDKNSKVPTCTSDRVIERNSSQIRNSGNEDCRCCSKENTLKQSVLQESTSQKKKYDSKPEDHVSTSVSDLRTGKDLLEKEERVFELKRMKDISKQEIHVFDIKEREKDILKVEEKYSVDSICALNSNSEDSYDMKCSCCGEDIDGRNDIQSNKSFICPDEKLARSCSIMAENATTSQTVQDTSDLRRSGFIIESKESSIRDRFPNRFTTSKKNSIDLSQICSASGERNSTDDTRDRNDSLRNSSIRSNVKSSPITESLFVFCEGSNAKQFFCETTSNSSTDEEENCHTDRRESHGKFKSPCRGSVSVACRRKSIYSVTCDPACTTRDPLSRIGRNVAEDRPKEQKGKDGVPIVSRCKNRPWRGSMVRGGLCSSFPAVDRIKYLIRKKLRKLLLEERDKGTSTSKTFLRNDRYLVSISSGKLNDSRITRESCPAGSSIRCPFTTRNRYEARGSPERTFDEGSCLGKNRSIFGDIVRERCQRMTRGNDILKKIKIGDVSRSPGQKRDSKSTDTQDLMMGDGGETAGRSKQKGRNEQRFLSANSPWRDKSRKSRNRSSVVALNSRRMVFFEDDHRDHSPRQKVLREKHDSKEKDRTKDLSTDSKLKYCSRRDQYEHGFPRSSYEYKNGSNTEDVTCYDKLRSFEKRLFKLERRRDEENNFAVLLSDYEKRVNKLDADFRLKLLQYVMLCRSVKNSLMKRLQPDDVYQVTSSSA